MILEKELEVADCVQGQFAATVTSVADLNGDELQDVAVGAPLEDDGRGAVYIYLGNWTQGIRSQYSQVHPKTTTHGINPSPSASRYTPGAKHSMCPTSQEVLA